MFRIRTIAPFLFFGILIVIVVYLVRKSENFSPLNSYSVDDTKVDENIVTELKTSIPSTIPSTDTYTPFTTKFSLTPVFVSLLAKEFPDYNFAPEIKDLKISPTQRDFVFKVYGITKTSPALLSLVVHYNVIDPLKYLNSDGDFFIPPNSQPTDFTLVGVSLNKETTQTLTSILPNSPFFEPYSRITNNLFLLEPFEKSMK